MKLPRCAAFTLKPLVPHGPSPLRKESQTGDACRATSSIRDDRSVKPGPFRG